jgi:hypothetical protein
MTKSAKQSQFAGGYVEANLRPGKELQKNERIAPMRKQSQFERSVKFQVGSVKRKRWRAPPVSHFKPPTSNSPRVKQSQSGVSRGGGPGHTVRNKPNSARGRRAEQSQFPRGWRAKQSQSWGRGAMGLRIEGRRRMTESAKQSQFEHARGRLGHPSSRRRHKNRVPAGENAVSIAPGGTRTPNPQLRRLMLYPIKLQARKTIRVYCGSGILSTLRQNTLKGARCLPWLQM